MPVSGQRKFCCRTPCRSSFEQVMVQPRARRAFISKACEKWCRSPPLCRDMMKSRLSVTQSAPSLLPLVSHGCGSLVRAPAFAPARVSGMVAITPWVFHFAAPRRRAPLVAPEHRVGHPSHAHREAVHVALFASRMCAARRLSSRTLEEAPLCLGLATGAGRGQRSSGRSSASSQVTSMSSTT
jgi:hypothetical protein